MSKALTFYYKARKYRIFKAQTLTFKSQVLKTQVKISNAGYLKLKETKNTKAQGEVKFLSYLFYT